MKATANTFRSTLLTCAAISLVCLIGLFSLGHFEPLPDRAAHSEGSFVYYGPEGVTKPQGGSRTDDIELGRRALQDAAYFGAFAVGPDGRHGVWTGAWTPTLARSFALAACGSDCQIVAERHPRHVDPSRSERVATTAMARNLASKAPYGADYISTGGAGAWGHRSRPSGKTGTRGAMRRAVADCEARRAAEGAPDPSLSPPCRIGPLVEVLDMRPKGPLYPAPYDIQLTTLTPVAQSEVVKRPDAPRAGLLGPVKPPHLFGARAANGETSVGVARSAGWPKAGEQIALAKCNAERRPAEPPCVVTHQRLPATQTPADALPVTPEVYESFADWQETKGAGAFAISPYGAWGTSSNQPTRKEALQKAADWCWYYTQKNHEFRRVKRLYLAPDLRCRIVALRAQGDS